MMRVEVIDHQQLSYQCGDDSPVWDCAVITPTHPARGRWDEPGSLLGAQVVSVRNNALLPRWQVIATDVDRLGAAITRQAALDAALRLDPLPAFVSFVDSDDTVYSWHFQTHAELLAGGYVMGRMWSDQNLGDVASSWFDGNGIAQAWESTHRGKPWDHEKHEGPHPTMTITVRTSLAAKSTFLHPEMHPDWTGEDWKFIVGLSMAGARFVNTPKVTWTYAVHGGNTSGSAKRGDALNQ